jgi:hypothetical protein
MQGSPIFGADGQAENGYRREPGPVETEIVPTSVVPAMLLSTTLV